MLTWFVLFFTLWLHLGLLDPEPVNCHSNVHYKGTDLSYWTSETNAWRYIYSQQYPQWRGCGQTHIKVIRADHPEWAGLSMPSFAAVARIMSNMWTQQSYIGHEQCSNPSNFPSSNALIFVTMITFSRQHIFRLHHTLVICKYNKPLIVVHLKLSSINHIKIIICIPKSDDSN